VREVSIVTHRTNLKRRMIDVLKDEILDVVPKNMLNKDRGKLVEWR